MKILHITDSHGTVKSPESRTDIYYIAFLKKMYELKYVIQQENIKLIIHTGDMFHSPKISDKFAGQLAEIIKSYGVPMYVVPGNHDITGYNINTLDQTKLGLLYKTGVVKELDRDHSPIQLKSQKENLVINIAGQEYYKDIDTGNIDDFKMQSSSIADFNILAIHGYLCDKPQHPDIRHTLCQNITTDANVILSGHFHESFEYHGQDFSVYNPGSMMRIEQTAYNKSHMPQYGILDIYNVNGVAQHKYTMCQFKIAEPSEKVFDYNLKSEKKKTLITLESFKNSIANTNFNQNLNTSIENIINDVAKNMSMTQDIIDKTVDIYHDAFNNSPDKLEIQQGFIPDINRKIIKSVNITNFQSHENTTIDFKDGLNTIIGESNSGKTSILRAIRWCLDNDPKGSDFITTGKDGCCVSVTFDDGTSITRERTRNDSGKYIVVGKTIQPDGTASKWMQVYKGFANNLPVEIMNVHQMPKVNLTKDICIHLNMMSQLDGPFLVTESPQVKAAIIGRLTGTQIIDLAVKDTNKTILDNSKAIKICIQEKQNREDELTKYQDLVYYETYIRLYRYIFYHIKNLFSIAEHVCNLVNDAEERINHIQEINNNIINTQNNIDMYQNMILIKQYIIDQSDIFEIQKEFQDTQNNVNALNKRMKWLIIITSLKQFVDTFNIKIGLYTQLSNGYQKVLSLQQQIQTDTNNINNIGNDISIIENSKRYLSNIYNYMNVLSRDINSTKPLYDKAVSRQSNMLQYNNTLNTSIEDINSYTEQISELTSQQEKIIQDNNICPCCGQKITAKKHVQNINNFMKGR